MCDCRPVGLEWRVGKQAFERQNLCNSFNPCSELLKIPLLLFHFSMEVLIQSITYWMVIGGIDVGRNAFKPLQTFSSCFLLNMCMSIDYLHHQCIYISKLSPSHPLTTQFIHDCIFFLAPHPRNHTCLLGWVFLNVSHVSPLHKQCMQ